MEITEFLRLVIALLDSIEIPYVVTGSVATIHYGEPRSTNDIDIIIDASLEKVRRLVRAVEQEAMASMEAAEDAWKHKEMFNIIHYETIEKIDFIFLKNGAFDKSVFSRRRLEQVLDLPMYMVTPEDAVDAGVGVIASVAGHRWHHFNAVGKDGLDVCAGVGEQTGLVELFEQVLNEAGLRDAQFKASIGASLV